MSGSVSQDGAASGGGSDPGRADPAAVELVFAMCHEISNAVTAIRLQAHLIDEELDG